MLLPLLLLMVMRLESPSIASTYRSIVDRPEVLGIVSLYRILGRGTPLAAPAGARYQFQEGELHRGHFRQREKGLMDLGFYLLCHVGIVPSS